MGPFAKANWGHHRGDSEMTMTVRDTAVRVLGTAIVRAITAALLVSCSTATSSAPEAQAIAAAEARSYIVEGKTTDTAAKAVTEAGGKVVSRLNVIDAVEATLTDTQHAQVKADAGVKQITENALVT